ncbi:adenylosuccinate synthase [candidate division WOR-3 bacterium]|nr:adenylosuccinate synthase [candidate division WOR-3 bacterium]
MPNLVVIGTQWGDEGKGKIVDFLAQGAQIVVRFQGGPNAGHTVCWGRYKLTFHQVPSGLLQPRIKGIIGCGCVVDPYRLEDELTLLKKNGKDVTKRLLIDRRAHIIFPYHKALDRLQEEQLAEKKIGTTGQGIGPAYQDKYARVGIRAGDLLNEDLFMDKLRRNVAAANFRLMELYRAEPISFKELGQELWTLTRNLAAMVGDGTVVLERALRTDKRILFEGAQGTHLDIDLGSYPFVTTSSTVVAGAATGSGISPLWLEEAVGVAKAYTTRVGAGPFPSELEANEAALLRELGGEYGATTGRPRRCGWFDAGVVRAAVRYNRLTALVLTKLDVLDSLSEIKVCVGYRYQGKRILEFDPFLATDLQPEFIALPGWREKTTNCRTYRSLPIQAKRYIEKIAELVNCPVALVSVGSERRAIVPVNIRRLRWLKNFGRGE